MGRKRIPVSEETRKKLRVMKAEGEYRSYDDLLVDLIEDGEQEGTREHTDKCAYMDCDVTDDSDLVLRSIDGVDSIFAYCEEHDPVDDFHFPDLFTEVGDGSD